MKNIFRILLALGITMFFVGCESKHNLTLTGFNSQEVLTGLFDETNKTVTVSMPDGEVLSGGYSAISGDGAVSFGNTVGYSGGRYGSGGFGGIGLGFNFGGGSVKYALLSSQKSDLKMEILMTIKNWSKDGFGEARTNDGRVYKIQF